jgi:hypothetical protein
MAPCRVALLLPLLLATLLLAPAPCAGKVIYTRLFRDDRMLIPVAPDFAFSEQGRIDIQLSGGCVLHGGRRCSMRRRRRRGKHACMQLSSTRGDALLCA